MWAERDSQLEQRKRRGNYGGGRPSALVGSLTRAIKGESGQKEKHNKQQISGEESQKGRLPASSKMPRKMKNK